VSRIFLSLVTAQYLCASYAFYRGLSLRGLNLHDLEAQSAVSFHLNFGMLFVIVPCFFCHAVLLTYFMGTGRWLEETCTAYEMGGEFRENNMQLKWRAYPAMTICFALLLGVMITGVAADPGSMIDFTGWGGMSAARIHLTTVITTMTINLAVNIWEYFAIRRNGELVKSVMARVREMRMERGLEV
jgi:hypothetical protein